MSCWSVHDSLNVLELGRGVDDEEREARDACVQYYCDWEKSMCERECSSNCGNGDRCKASCKNRCKDAFTMRMVETQEPREARSGYGKYCNACTSDWRSCCGVGGACGCKRYKRESPDTCFGKDAGSMSCWN